MAKYDRPQVLSLIDSQSLAPVHFDIGLPTGGGSKILRFVGQKSPHTPVILATGYQLADLPQLLAEAPDTR
jgi:DNA-binding NtrC family response regulator